MRLISRTSTGANDASRQPYHSSRRISQRFPWPLNGYFSGIILRTIESEVSTRSEVSCPTALFRNRLRCWVVESCDAD